MGYSMRGLVEGSVIVATIQAEIDHSVQAKIGVSASWKASTNVPKKRCGNAYWGPPPPRRDR
ncbi:hypothetical protein [Pilimelia anulata]|uniref:hypothetical protein n=1 Tax=Pilimelia anulata TaxID=53371 RepID=UPI00166E6A92|nr:hypothetical protein [Pilimelia anulata]